MEESECIEFKSSLADEDGILTALVAFANKKGGSVYIGINDSGKVIGVDVGKNTIEKLALLVSKNTDPSLFPSITLKNHNGKTVICITVKESSLKPHFYKNKSYSRVGKSNVLLSASSIKQLILEQSTTTFEDNIVESFNLKEDLDFELVNSFISKAIEAERLPIKSAKKPIEAMSHLNLLKSGKATNALVLLFAKNPRQFIPYYGVKIAALATDHFSISNLIYNEEFTLPLFKVIDEIIPKMQGYIPRKISLEGIRRVEKPLVPIDALREFTLNMLIHSDYSIPSSMRVVIGKTYLKMTNPGTSLLKPIDALYSEHNSLLRNPKIAHAFFTAGYVEKFGQGTNMALNALISNSGLIPNFEEKNQTFTIYISFTQDRLYEKILQELKEEKSIEELSKVLNAPSRTLREKMKRLVSNSIVKIVKTGRNVKYSKNI